MPLEIACGGDVENFHVLRPQRNDDEEIEYRGELDGRKRQQQESLPRWRPNFFVRLFVVGRHLCCQSELVSVCSPRITASLFHRMGGSANYFLEGEPRKSITAKKMKSEKRKRSKTRRRKNPHPFQGVPCFTIARLSRPGDKSADGAALFSCQPQFFHAFFFAKRGRRMPEYKK